MSVYEIVEKRENNRLFFITLFIYAIVFTDMLRLISTITGFVVLLNNIEVFRNIIYVFVFCGYYYNSTSRIRLSGFVTGLVYAILMLITMIINPQIDPFVLMLSLQFISRYLLAFIMICHLKNPIELIRKITSLAWLLPFYVTLYLISPHNLSIGYAYNMTFSYNLLLPAVACMYSLLVIKEKKLICIIGIVSSVVGIIGFGSRGTLICFLFPIMYLVLIHSDKRSPRWLILQLIIFSLAIVLIIKMDDLFSAISSYFTDSRLLFLIEQGDFFWDSNRTYYYDGARTFLLENPFMVSGIAGDCTYYSNLSGAALELGRHSHNLFLELIVSYGVIIGGALSGLILYRMIMCFIYSKKGVEARALLVCIVIPLIPFILISGSLCQSYQSWLLLGGLFNIYYTKQTNLMKNVKFKK